MHVQSTLLAMAPLVMMVRAGFDFDLNDSPRQCRDICRPLADLARQCNVDLRGDDNDRKEDQLEAQCFCTNSSFDVAGVAARCQDCIRRSRDNGGHGHHDHDHDDDRDDDWDDYRDNTHRINRRQDGDEDEDGDGAEARRMNRRQDGDEAEDGDGAEARSMNRRDDHNDAFDDINKILRTCGFPSTTFPDSATSAMTSVSVSAARPTDVSQLTTSFNGGRGSQITPVGNTFPTGAPGTNNDNNNYDNDRDGYRDAAGMFAPSLWLAGALVAGGVALVA